MSFQHQSQGCAPARHLNEAGRAAAERLAQDHGFSVGAVAELLFALDTGGGRQAQFEHVEFGGMGQWSAGGMLMIGDMFNDALKARMSGLLADAAGEIASQTLLTPRIMGAQVSSDGWPAELGTPAATGAQNDVSYAVYPAARRLAIRIGGQTAIYDTGDHVINGFSQQQGGSATLGFTSQHGTVPLASLRLVGDDRGTGGQDSEAGSPDLRARSRGSVSGDDILAKIEGLATLHAKRILTDEEFSRTKSELLARL